MIWLLLFSLIIFVISSTGVLLILNYTVISWESKVLDRLGKKNTDSVPDILSKSKAVYSPDNKDYSSDVLSQKKDSNKVSRGLIKVYNSKYPIWFIKLNSEIIELRQNFVPTIRKWFSNFITLFKNRQKDQSPHDILKSKVFQEEVSQVSEKITNQNALMILEEEQSKDLESPTSKEKSVATLDIANKNNKSTNLVLEKMEKKILRKLQESGMSNYDLWLNLGEVYMQHNEKEKANQIFALVLKHATGKPKEIARNYLISM